MRKFTSGLTSGFIAGSVLGLVGLTAIMSDKSTRQKAMKSGKRAMDDAAHMMDDVKSKIW